MSFDTHYQIVPLDQQTGGPKVFTFGFTSAVAVRGPQKLINRWLKCLMTPKGSDPSNLEYGTGFGNLYGSNITSTQDLIDAVALFVEDCNAQMRAMDQRNFPPDDERLKSATLSRVLEVPGGFEVTVEIRNVAGERVVASLPRVA